jgi:hypothetical protein
VTDLLIHSMAEFAETILAALRIAGARELVEIGAEHGGMSCHLADYAVAVGGRLTSIDPAPAPGFLDWLPDVPHVRHLAAPSLSAMPALAQVDAWVIDGDHNYYTVRHELAIADRLARRDGRPFLAFLHDVGWPCARRDQYYAPASIPPEWCHPHRFDAGVIPGRDAPLPARGFRGMGRFALACHEGGPRNGVLTAVEDHLADARTRDAQLAFAFIPAVFGLGVVFAADQPWSASLAQLLMPLHDDALLARLEANRLANYLAVVDWQDRETERLAATA